MTKTPQNPQIYDIKAKGRMRIQLNSVLMALSGSFFLFFAGLAPSVKIPLCGYLGHLQYVEMSWSREKGWKAQTPLRAVSSLLI